MTELTSQQKAFIATANSSGSVALRARAGTGKTFSLRQWATTAKRGGIATSFSKSTVQELTKKMPTKFQAKTLHAMGLQALKSKGNPTKIENGKIFEITKALASDLDLSFELQEPIRKLATIGFTYGIQPDSSGPEGLTHNSPAIWESLADQYDVDFSPEILSYAIQVMNQSTKLALKDGQVSFDDMLYIPLIYGYRFPRYPIILADEVQDFNTLQHTMLRRCLLPNGRIIAAGDDRQAIYAFRGALSDSYTSLVKTFSMSELPLTVSFRCPSEVIKVAQAYVPDIEAAPGCAQGSVLYPTFLDLSEIPPVVLCRNNAPLIRLALALLVHGTTVEVAGKDIGKGLIALTKRITKKNLSSEAFRDRLAKWREREITRYPRREPTINDKHSALYELSLAHKDLSGIQHHLTKLYPDPSGPGYRPAQCQLSTIHRAKGREWPRVLFLDPQLLPSKYATQDWELTQEANLGYVGVTRAQEELIFCPSKSIEGLEG
jgi:hypothetical protein